MNGAAISTITVLLLLLGIGLQSTWQLDRLVNQFGNQLEVSVFLQSDTSATQILPKIEPLAGVDRIRTVTKEEAWEALAQDLGLADAKAATAQFNGNPLVDELRVRARTPEAVPTLVSQVRQIKGVDEVQYLPEILQQLQQLNRGINVLGLGVVTLLTITALAVITTTIRLIVVARRREIEIMKLVGATSLWICLPFVVQGMVFGLVGGAIAWGFLVGTQQFVAGLVSQQPDFVKFIVQGLELETGERFLLPAILMSFGGSVGIIGSFLAVGRMAWRS